MGFECVDCGGEVKQVMAETGDARSILAELKTDFERLFSLFSWTPVEDMLPIINYDQKSKCWRSEKVLAEDHLGNLWLAYLREHDGKREWAHDGGGEMGRIVRWWHYTPALPQ